nr:hypothetical protein [Tanacetum cinerariifolium]
MFKVIQSCSQETPRNLTTGDRLSSKVKVFLIPVIEKMMNVTAAGVFLSLFKWAKMQTLYKACDDVYSLNECRDFDKHMLMADSREFDVEAELDQEGKLSMLFMKLFLKVYT